jgi:hypothetical protein
MNPASHVPYDQWKRTMCFLRADSPSVWRQWGTTPSGQKHHTNRYLFCADELDVCPGPDHIRADNAEYSDRRLKPRESAGNSLRCSRFEYRPNPLFRNPFSPAVHPNLSDTWRHTTKFRLTKRGYETIHGHKYLSTYKYLPCKNAGIWKRNITHVG